MKELIQAVQKVFWGLIAASIAVGAIAIPRPRDGDLTRAEAELEQFSQSFDQAALEATLLEMAAVQGKTTLKNVAERLEASGLPEQIEVKNPKATVAPLSALQLATLKAVHRHSKPDSSLDIAALKPDKLATALSWRLAYYGRDAKVVLKSITLQRAAVDQAQAAREKQAFDAREKKLATARAFRIASRKHGELDDLYRARIKWKAHWKMIARANEKRQEAKVEMDALQAQLDTDTEAYKALADAALAFEPSGDAGKTPEFGVAEVVATIDGSDKTLHIPVALSVRTVPVAPLSASSFPVAHETGLWEAIEDQTPTAALQAVRARFSWHHSALGLGLLHGLPVLLPVLLLLLMHRIRLVSNGYSPFNTDGRGGLPQVGLGQPLLDAAIVTTLPTVASALCAWSLLRLGHTPTVPGLCAIGCALLGLRCYGHLRELRTLTEAVVRSRSAPPPPGLLDHNG